jgi:hypothetical protein
MKILTIEQAMAQDLECKKYDQDRYEYEDKDGVWHLIHNGIEVSRGDWVYSYDIKRHQYQDNDGIQHLIHNGEEVAQGKSVFSYSLDRYSYQCDGFEYFINRTKN